MIFRLIFRTTGKLHHSVSKPIFAIRKAVPADSEGIGLVQKLTWRATYPNMEHNVSVADIVDATKWWDQPGSIEKFAERIANEGDSALRLVAVIGPQIVGHCFARKLESVNRLDVLYVLPEFHSNHIGLGLAESALEWLGKDKDILLDVATYNTHAIRFYVGLQFKITRTLPEYETKLANGTLHPQLEMRRQKTISKQNK